MHIRPGMAIIVIAVIFALIVPLAFRPTDSARGQVFPPGPPVTTPQPTVPCVPADACGPGGSPPVNFVWAYIQRYCNGSAVPTPVGQTTFALVYGNGSLSATTAAFSGSVLVNNVEVPSNPLETLTPGDRDVRLRQGVVNDGDIFTVNIQAVNPAGAPIAFGDGKTTKVLSASGSCPAEPLTPTPNVSIPAPNISLPPGPFTSIPSNGRGLVPVL